MSILLKPIIQSWRATVQRKHKRLDEDSSSDLDCVETETMTAQENSGGSECRLNLTSVGPMDGSDSNQLTSISLRSVASEPVCRICQDVATRKNKLISPCHCSGSMGYFHINCLELWLAQSASNCCEVCSFEYQTIRKSKPFREWLRSPRSHRDRRYVWADLVCFLLLTPLGSVSSWLCVSGAWQYYKDGEHWTGFGLIFLTSFLAIMYLFWAALTVRYHCQSFKKWMLENQDVHLVVENSGVMIVAAKSSPPSTQVSICQCDSQEYETVAL